MMTKEQLLQFLRQELGTGDVDIDAETPLFSSGVIDSFALVSLVAFVEQHCAFRVNGDEMTLENWDSVTKILELIARRQASVRG